ncbi:radical SAM/SPASM domain-containing protein [Erythrobacter sp. JK5]|uniref:radical SAM/SPASM domain-containing protein n=1 Tax=Erythrobacter sp. JK5 TaxID=2829500 RepID=UPI001BA47394|nr:radical SAM protein [Erythrobacter sp. JK5]QUL38773.1 radical SAM protein [Erythrobacter sp. JK5]
MTITAAPDRPAPAERTATLKPVAFHHFGSRGRHYLFDIDRVIAHDSNPEEGALLALARDGGPLSRDGLLERFCQTDAAIAADHAAEMIDSLIERGLLVGPAEPIERAPIADASDYATFMVNVSQRCNLTCPYCYVNKGHFDYSEVPIPKMPMARAETIVDHIHANFPELRIYGYHFYGGEPLLNFKAIRRIVEQAEAKARATGTETDYHITTNGTLLTAEIADFMAEHRFTVYYSIDSDEQTHDELRKYINGNGSYADVERNLRLLVERPGVHLIGSSVVREANSLGEAIEKLAETGASQCKAERVRLTDDDPLALVDDAFGDYLDDIRDLADHYIDYIDRSEKPLDYRLTSKILQLLTHKRRDFFCPAGDRMFGVSSDGELYPCALHVGRPQSVLGDVENGPDPDKVAAFREKFSAAGQEVCRACWNRTLCGGGCSAMVDRFGHEKCDSLRAESEAAIIVYRHFARTNPVQLIALVSPKIAQWAGGELDDADSLTPREPAAELRSYV